MIESLWAELAPSPGRWRRAIFIALGTTTALVLAWWLQVPDFSAPVVAFFGLQPSNVCTWRNLLPRLLRAAAAALACIALAGVLVQLPWLLLPVFFAGMALIAYISPVTRGAPELLAVAYPFLTAFYQGVFDPAGMPTAVGEICFGYAIGIVTATVFAQLLSPDDPATTLAGALADGFAHARARLATVTAHYAAERLELLPGEPPLSSQFARDMQSLERVRQEGRHRDDVPFLALAVVVVDRALTLTDTIDALARRPVGRTYRRLLAPQLTALVAELDAGLRACELAARQGGAAAVTAARHEVPAWPDYRAAVAAVHAEQDALARRGGLASVDLDEEANTHAFVQALVDLTDSLHLSPAELREQVGGDPGPAAASLLRLDPQAARYALSVALGTTIAYVIGLVADTPEFFSVLFHPVFLAVSSYGATIRRAGTRVAGTVIGCLVAIMTTIAVMPNIHDLPALALLLLAVTVPSAYVALGGPRFSYAGLQIVVAFVIVGLGEQPVTDIHQALLRVYATLLGTGALFLAFRLVGPDYAGRQLVARFTDAVRGMLTLLPRPGVAALVPARGDSVRQEILTGLPDVLRLTDEARAETATGGVDTEAAIAAGGRAVRIGIRLAAIRGGRVTHPRPPESTGAALADVEGAIRAWLEIALGMLQARDTMARPGSRGYRQACAAAAAVAARPRPDLAGPLSTLERAVEAARPPAERGAFVAEVEHLRRVVELLPSLDASLTQMILPHASRHRGLDARIHTA